MAAAILDLYAADPGLQVLEAEATGLCPTARDLFLDGVHKARFDGPKRTSVFGVSPALPKREALRA